MAASKWEAHHEIRFLFKNLDRYITLESTDNEKSKMTDGFYASQAKQKSNRLQSDGLKGI